MSPIIRASRRLKVARLNSSPDSEVSNDPEVPPTIASDGLDPIDDCGWVSISSDEEGTGVRKSKRAKGVTMAKPNVNKSKGKASVRRDSEEREAESFGDSIGPPHMVAMSAATLGACAMEWAGDLEDCRAKSRNIQGSVSGAMKRNIAKLKDVICTLVGKAEASGDPSFLRVQLCKLSRQVKMLKENTSMKVTLDESLKRIKDLEDRRDAEEITKAELRIAKKRIVDLEGINKGSKHRLTMDDIEMSVFGTDEADAERVDADDAMQEDTSSSVHGVLEEHGLQPVSCRNEGVRRPSLRGVSAEIPEPPLEDVIVLTDKSRREIELTSQIDELVRKRREVREDIVRMADDICEPSSEASGVAGCEVRSGPRIISDVRIVPPRFKVRHMRLTREGAGPGPPNSEALTGSGGSWTRVSKRSRKRARRPVEGRSVGREQHSLSRIAPASRRLASLDGARLARVDSASVTENTVGMQGRSDVGTPHPSERKRRIRRVPKSAAVSIKRNIDGPSYADLLRRARETVALDGLGISGTRIRWSANGAILIEIPGQDKSEKAELLASKIGEALEGEAIVTRPVAIGELFIKGFDESISDSDITEAILASGGCRQVDVKVGPINRMFNGLCSVWVRCPLVVALKVADSGNLRVGWSTAWVVLQQARPIQCYRCWNYGHTSERCKSSGSDWSKACFRCGKRGHVARECTATPMCVVCSRLGLPDQHRMGSKMCKTAESARASRVSNNSGNNKGVKPYVRAPPSVTSVADVIN